MQTPMFDLATSHASDALMLLLMMLLLLKAELGILQFLHLRYRCDRTAMRLTGRVQQLAFRRGMVEGVPEVVIVRLALVLTD